MEKQGNKIKAYTIEMLASPSQLQENKELIDSNKLTCDDCPSNGILQYHEQNVK